jgi:hypothetical protein
MPRLFHTGLGSRDLRRCPSCAEPFVVPREILATQADGHVVDLACTNCGWWAIERHDDAHLDALERALDSDTARIANAAEALALASELERIDLFAAALHAGHILPEDF